jgi:uncharacterized Tic20 family protein
MSTGPETPPPPSEPDQPAGEPPLPPPQPASPAPPAQPGGYGPPPQGYGQAPPPTGYVAGPPPMRPDEEKLWAIGANLGPLIVGVIAPLVVWLVFKDRSAFLDRTGKEALNMQLSYLIYGVVSGLSIILLVGLVLFPIVMVAWVVLMIIATIKVANFEEYRYPAIIRFIK